MKREKGSGGGYKKRGGGGGWGGGASGGKVKRERKEKPCPAFKKINGTNVIDCSEITAKLMFIKLGVSPNYVRPLSMFTPHMIEGTEVTLLPANHCPGAVLLLFKVNGRYILHVGDFRYHPNMQTYDELRNNEIHTIYLDTTYCAPHHSFPPREEAVNRVVDLALREKRKPPGANTQHQSMPHHKESTLFLVGTYCIGKEDVFCGIARACGMKAFVTREKYVLLQCMDIPDFDDIITTDSTATNLHVVPMNCLSFQKMGLLMSKMKARYSRIIGIRPTGWAGDVKHTTKRSLELYEVPYSEHSNYYELREFVEFLRPTCIVPTVSCWSQAKVEAQLYHFRDLMKGSTAPPPDFGAAARGRSAITSHFERKTVGSVTTTSTTTSTTTTTTSSASATRTLFQLPARSSSSPSFLASTITSYFGFTNQRKPVSNTSTTPNSTPGPAFSASPAFFSFFSRSRSDSSIKREVEPKVHKEAWDVDDDDQFLYEASLLLDDSKAELIKDESQREGDEEKDDAEDEQATYSPLAFSEGEDEGEEEAAYADEVGLAQPLSHPSQTHDQGECGLVPLTLVSEEDEYSQEGEAPPPSRPSTPLRGGSSPFLAHDSEPIPSPSPQPTASTSSASPLSPIRAQPESSAPSTSSCSSSPSSSSSLLSFFPVRHFHPSPSSGRLSLKRKRAPDSASNQPSPTSAQTSTPPALPQREPRASTEQPIVIDLTDDGDLASTYQEPTCTTPMALTRGTTDSASSSPAGPLATFVSHGRLSRVKSDPALRGHPSAPSPTAGDGPPKRRRISGGVISGDGGKQGKGSEEDRASSFSITRFLQRK